MYPKIRDLISTLAPAQINEARKLLLDPIVEYVQQKVDNRQPILLNFICTHNSRRSHLAQIWAQTAASYYGIPMVQCYSGGTEATQLFPKIAETLSQQGFKTLKLSESSTPIYFFKFSENAFPVVGFSKKWNDEFNPYSSFAAIMTCSEADSDCPYIPGAEKRFVLSYQDPKSSDQTPEQTQVYAQRSLQIAAELFYIFSKINA